MNKSAAEKFAKDARRMLLQQITQKAAYYGITPSKIHPVEHESTDGVVINGVVHNKHIKEQRQKLVNRIESGGVGFHPLIEQVAYTWFNRFIALRFMEVNGYLPTGVRVFSSLDENKKQPDILTECLNVDLPLDKEELYRLLDKKEDEALYQRLLIAQCNALHETMPFLFEKVQDETELLIPPNLLYSDFIIDKMVKNIPEEDWREVEIIGWLYQYYISEKKDEAIKAKQKYRNDQIPVVTQLFTPKWIVQYMVDNTIGRAWMEAHPNSALKPKLEFYIEPKDQSQPEHILLQHTKPEDITVFDPACGSGHILVYAFDVLYHIYAEQGYDKRDIPKLILERNLYGLDIDVRAAQLACFALLMKARQYNRLMLEEDIKWNVHAFQDSQGLEALHVAYEQMLEDYQDAKTLGSLIQPQKSYTGNLFDQPELVNPEDDFFAISKVDQLKAVVKQTVLLTKKYDFVITNPPYIGSKYFNPLLSAYINKHYPNTKADLFATFIDRSFSFTKEHGFLGMVTPFVWMFIQSYEWLREKIVQHKSISSLIQLEYNAFECACIPVCSFILRNYQSELQGDYIQLSEFRGHQSQPIKTLEAIKNPSVGYRYSIKSSEFARIPGSPIAYWVSDKVREIFENSPNLLEYAQPRQGMSTSDNEKFLRIWFETKVNEINFNISSIEESKRVSTSWIPYNKGGQYRKWYGNQEYVISLLSGNNRLNLKDL